MSTNEWFEIGDLRLIPALRHLRNLRQLSVEPPLDKPVELGFVGDLPTLRDLRFRDADTLDALAGCSIGWLWQLSEAPGRSPLSLAPLVEMPTLTQLYV